MAKAVQIKVKYPRIDFRKTRDAVHKRMTKFTIDTMSDWVKGTTDPIPVWSGASRASFLILAAKAFTSIVINPVVPSRITLGITESTSEVFAKPGEMYGWSWGSTLFYIDIVEDRVNFIDAGLKAIKAKRVELPQPVTKPERKIK
jgi:hypothetical protein